MFSDCQGNAISFYNKQNIQDNKSQFTQTENKIKQFKEKEIQVIERTESSSQTNLKEIISKQTINYDEKKLEIFLNKVSRINLIYNLGNYTNE